MEKKLALIDRLARVRNLLKVAVLIPIAPLLLTACGGGASSGGDSAASGVNGENGTPSAPLTLASVSGASIILKGFEDSTVPLNREGDPYPKWSDGKGGEGGVFIGAVDPLNAVWGNSFMATIIATVGTGNQLYAEFNPYDGVRRDFARIYADNVAFDKTPTTWSFNTYNRWRYWIKAPAQMSRPYETDGRGNANIGAYAKRIANADYYSDEAGGGHFYYNQNWPLTGTWVQCTVNYFVDHWRGNSGGTEEGSAERITGEAGYNLFDALTRFYFQGNRTAALPAVYHIDEVGFYREVNPEPEQQVRGICATFIPGSNRVIVTWMRNKNENSVRHEVRYAFSDIHASGWNQATPAPGGTITPPGSQGYNGMYYDSTSLPVAGHSVLYIAIRPQGNNPQGLFAQVAIPLQ